MHFIIFHFAPCGCYNNGKNKGNRNAVKVAEIGEKKMLKLAGEYFYGNKASDYAIENGYLDYATLAKAFDAVMANNIIQDTWEHFGEWDMESGMVDNYDRIEELRNELNELEANDETEERNNRISEIEDEIYELENESEPECYQYFIVSDHGAEILKECGEIVYYNRSLDMYVWGVTHWGTSWDYVLTDIPLNLGDAAFQ